jgi:16S rRNA (adenine1518-N6/adenine1519-N6)-dimethyltransferase
LLERFPALRLVEIDSDAVDTLKSKLGGGDYRIYNEDALKFDFSVAGFPLHVVGNLPYNIGALIIKRALMEAPRVASCTFMVQREVAARIVSGPRSGQNGFLSIFCQFFGEAKLLFHVPPGAFFPRPNVDSSVFQIIIDAGIEGKLRRERWGEFFAFVSGGFSMRRKQIAKALSLRYGRDKGYYRGLLSEMGLDVAARPQDLGVGEWLDLYGRAGAS